jgi:hypothetical protein
MVTFKLDIPTLTGVALGLQTALRQVLLSVAEQHNNQPGQWLDGLEASALQEAKGAHSTGMPLEAENAMVGVGLKAVEAIFASVRKELTNAKSK